MDGLLFGYLVIWNRGGFALYAEMQGYILPGCHFSFSDRIFLSLEPPNPNCKGGKGQRKGGVHCPFKDISLFMRLLHVYKLHKGAKGFQHPVYKQTKRQTNREKDDCDL